MFQRRVLKVAIEEINEKTDLKIAYELEKAGRAILSIRFEMSINKKGIKSLSDQGEISNKLKSFGIQSHQIKKLLGKHSEDYISANILVLESELKNGKSIRNIP